MKKYRHINYFVKSSVNMFTVVIYFPGKKGKVTSGQFSSMEETTTYLVGEIDRHFERTVCEECENSFHDDNVHTMDCGTRLCYICFENLKEKE